MGRVKHLPKHLQPRWRYLAVSIECWPETTLERDAFQRALWYEAQNLLGDPGSAAVGLSVVRFQATVGTAVAIVRTHRGEEERARAAVACIDHIDGAPVGLRVRGVSGTIRACEEKYMGDQPEESVERNVAFEDADRPAFVRNERVDVRIGNGFVGATTLNMD